MSECKENISDIETLICQVKREFAKWKTSYLPWFRGESCNFATPLRPSLYRNGSDVEVFKRENYYLQNFRRRASSFSDNMPPRHHTDEWLFLAQHTGLPTRLLDWTEGLLVALYFALQEQNPVVWMLNPYALNAKTEEKDIQYTRPKTEKDKTEEDENEINDNEFPLTWFSPHDMPIARKDLGQLLTAIPNLNDIVKVKGEIKSHNRINFGNRNFQAAWMKNKGRKDEFGTELPVAILPSVIHERMVAQKSCFTIHGKKICGLAELVDDDVLKKFVLSNEDMHIKQMKKDLVMMGITKSSIYPDLDSLTKDIVTRFALEEQ